MKNESLSRWTIDECRELYGIKDWGAGYFDISDDGCVTVSPGGDAGDTRISMMDVISGLKARGLEMPVLLRFSDILASRVAMIHTSFSKAITELGYKGAYRGVYPIKVNQQQQVVEDVMACGGRFHHGLEAGSKAELIAALAYMHDPEGVIVCNGYKDEEFVDLALHGLKMGIPTIIVLEMLNELPLVLERAEKIGVEPCLGIRVKLSTRASGYWTESGGDRSMFGMTSSQIISTIDRLRELGKLHCLKLLHYHVGSQIPNIRSIRAAAAEASRFYVDLIKEGAGLTYIDVGGGLAVDYDGSHTNFASSSNYAIDEYAADIVEAVMKNCDETGVEHPIIVSESGRATVAYHSVLLFNVLDVSSMEVRDVPGDVPDDSPEPIKLLWEVNETLTSKNLQECYHDAVYYRDEVRSLYQAGQISLRQRALAEKMFWHLIFRIAQESKSRKYIPEELQGLDTATADVYYGNFSVFQSLPDAWAIQQLFPILPVHRLSEQPVRRATLADITCDCDGKIDRFIDLHDVKHTLRLHDLRDDEEYYLGVFLIGAYQETLGDLHNLLGDTNVVNLSIGSNGELNFEQEIEGDSVADVLSYVEYNPQDILARVRRKAEEAVRKQLISPQERRKVVELYQDGLRGYTYFER